LFQLTELGNIAGEGIFAFSQRGTACTQAEEDAMSKEQLLQELADAFEELIRTATEAAQRGVTRQGDTWGPREIVAHMAGWEVMATVRIPKIVAGMPPLEEADETLNALNSSNPLRLSRVR
jgi:hypothetical protein